MAICWGLSTGCTYDSEVGVQSSFDKALTHYRNGKFDKSIHYAQKYIKGADDKVTLARAYVLLGMNFQHQQNYKGAIQHYQHGLSIRIEVLGETHPTVGEVYNNLGEVYREQKDYEQALDFYNKGLELQTEGFKKASITNNIANVYKTTKKYNLALKHYYQALENYAPEKKHFAYNNIGLVYQDQRQYARAQEYFAKTLEERKKHLAKDHYLFSRTYNNIGKNYHLQGRYKEALKYYGKASGIQHQHDKIKLETLQQKANTEKSLKKKAQALKTLKQADQLITTTRGKLLSESDKLYFSEKSSEINQLGMAVALEVKDEATAFYFAERNKANVLAQTLQVSPTHSIQAIQKKLQPEQAILEYAFLDSTLVSFLITPTDFVIHTTPYDFSETVYNFAAFAQGLSFKDYFLRDSYATYQKVFRPMETHLKKTREVILVADRELHKVCFDAMVRKDYYTTYKKPKPGYMDTNFRGYDYLIDHYLFSYAPSASLAIRPKPQQDYRYDYAGFAPEKDNLKMNVLEVEHNARRFEKPVKYTGWWATVRQYQHASPARILHFSTHTLKRNPKKEEIALEMYRDTLTQQQIENTSRFADLTILSSCSANNGQYLQGEGYLSLVRSFIPKSNYIVYSLFDLSDAYGYGIMNIFLTNVAQGMPYKQALHQAKRTVLHEKESLPFAWAPVVIAE